ncbi:metal-dependent hydrolase [Pseudomonas sp. ICMP22404]|uniref:metal-dependent hydrolase n=1 Tax=Pseudomonas TaxID=286 RepID=UPI001119E79B|nr:MULTISPECIES: metal-dependent hydrolase [Pseudomonas]MCI0997139.1 metal-dependent hydrolase [Pseudomonas corrugata]NUT67635.1 metal-dependent hydrolase [Pseudomonas corrugata]TNF82676.1 metal-dependent hydrolase [Pseudomonas sp. ICMP22404]
MENQKQNEPLSFQPFWNDTPIKTYLFDAFSVLLPAGEQFVISVVESAASQLQQTSTLAAESRRFVAEERAHQRAHRLYNQQLEKQGFEVRKYEVDIEKDLENVQSKASPKAQLALAAAFEHVTAVISRIALRKGGLLSATESSQTRLWRWHCREEVAHQHVTTDLLRALGVPYWQRMLWFLVASALLAFDVLRHVHGFARLDIRRGRVSAAQVRRAAGRLLLRDGMNLVLLAAGWIGYCLPLSVRVTANCQ